MPFHTHRRNRSNSVTKPQLLTRWVPRPLEQLEDRLTPSTTLSNTPNWIDVGPNNITGGQTTKVTGTATNSSVIGAVQAVTPDLTDLTGNTLYAGGVNGGVWKTTNALAASPTWVPLTDNYPSLSISTIAINPDNNQQILAGIGGTADGTYSIDPNTGAKVTLDSRNVSGTVYGTTRGDLTGALYSSDGGATWKIISDKIGGQNVVGVAARGTTPANSYLLVATDRGLYRSTNAGTTFTQISGTGILPATGVFDLAADPGAPVSVVSDATWDFSTNRATITTVSPHALSTGQSVNVTGVNSIGGSLTGYNGTFTLTVVTANTFTYSLSTNPGTYVSGGTATANPNADPLARNRFYIAMKSAAGTTTGVGGDKVYRSDDGGLTWGDITSSIMLIGAKTTNIQISIFNSGIITNNIVYVAVENNNPSGAQVSGSEANSTGFDYAWANRFSAVSTISWSPNQGGTWTRMDAPRAETAQQGADVISDSAGTVIVSTGVRHHLRTGDQVFIRGVKNNGTATNNPPPALIGVINGVRYVTFIDETTFSLTGVNYTGTYEHIAQDTNLPIVSPNGTWTQVLGANAGERAEFFDLTADRTNSNILYLGTDRAAASAGTGSQFFPSATTGPVTFTGTYWRGDRLANPTGQSNRATTSNQWVPLTNAGTSNGSAPPADTRDLVMGANNQLFAATGGGIYSIVLPSFVITNATWSSATSTATITTSAPSVVAVGNYVDIAGVTPNGFNGLFRVTAVSGNTFSYSLVANPGAYSSGGALQTATTWNSNNGNLAVTDIASIAYDTQNNAFFAGTIDTQGIAQIASGGGAYSSVFSSTNLRDNFYDQANVFRVLADNSLLDNSGNFDGLTKRYYVGTNFSNILRQTVNGSNAVTGSTFLQFASPNSTTSPYSGLKFEDRQLINANETVRIAMALNLNDPRRAMFGYNGLYEDADPSGNTPTGAIVNDVTPPGMTGKVESILYGGKRGGVNFNQIVYMTTTTGELWVRGEFGPVFTNITPALTAASGQPGASVFSVVGDPDDYRHIFVAQGGKILESQDFGGTFVDISDNLIGPSTADGTAGPGKLTTEIRSLAIFDSTPGVSIAGDLTLVAGGRGGVYRLQTSTVNNGGSWTEYGTVLPNTVVNDLQLYNNQRLISGTAGRGIWDIADVSTTINQDSVLTIGGTAASDIITVSVDPDNSNIILVFDGTATTSWTRGAFSALQINGFGGADQIIIDSTIDRITHVPIAGGNVDFVNFKITVDGGGDAGDTLRIIDEGVTTARRVTITSTTIGEGAADTIFNGSGKVDYSGFDAGTIDISTGSGDDTYIPTSLMPGQTILRGGSGSDTYSTAMDPTSTSVLTIVEGVATGIDALNITGTVGNDTFSVGPAQVSLGTSKVNYSGIEDFAVSGANGNDTFNFTGAGGSVSNTFDGQAGNDVYKIPLNPATLTTYTVSDTGLVGTDDLEVTGTAGSDTFSITSAQVLLGLGVVDYSGIENLTVDALAGNDTYNLTLNPASTTNFTIADTGGIDTLRVTGTAGADAFSISSTQVVLGTKAADYSGIENLVVLGVNGNDTFSITGAGGTVGTTLDGGGGNDTYNVSMNPATATLLTISDTGVGGTDALNITGTAVADAFTVAPTQVLLGSETLNYTSNIETLRLSGLAGDDTFTMSTEGGSTNTTIDGGSGIDAFSILGTSGTDSVGVDITSALGDGSFTGLPQNVAFTSIQNLGFDGGAGTNSFTWRDRTDIAYGTALNPENGIVYTPSGAAKGSLRVGSGSAFPTVNFSNINSTFLVNGDPDGSGDRDVFTELGFSTAGSQSGFPFNEPASADGSDTFVVSDAAITLTNAALGSMRRVDFALAASGSGARTVSTIFVVGGNEATTGDRFTVTPSRLTNIVINGMNPVAGSAADQLTVISNGATTSFRTTDSKYGAPQTRMQQTIDGAAVGFYNIENVSVFDPSRGGAPPLINIFGAASVNEGALYALTLGALTDPGRTVTSYIVHWGDGITETYTTNGAKSHPYADGPNAYSITVDLVDEFGLHLNVANSSVRSLAVNNVAPTIAVTAGGTVAEGIASTLTLGAVTDPGQDTVTTFIVRWGDGNSNAYSTGGIKTHIYAGAGTYAVAVDLVDEDGTHTNRGAASLNVVTQELLDASKTNLTAAGVGADVVVYNSNGTTRFAFKPYQGYTGNVTVATGDITGDGIDDIVTGAESQVTHVKVFDGATGIEIASFLAYEGFRGGVTVAVGDVLGQGHAQVITGAGPGGGPHVKVFDVSGGGLVESRSFFAYGAGFLGGVSVGAGRLNSSGHDMIVTGAGVGGSSHVKAFDVAGGSPAELRSFFAFDPGFSGGVNVAAAFGNIAVGAGAGRGGHVEIFRFADGATLQSFFAYPDYDGGVRVAFGTRSGIPTIITGVGLKTPPRFQVFRLADLAVLDRFFIGNVAFDGGIYVG